MERIYLNASKGHILTNGEVYGKTIYLADDMDRNAFYEITEEKYNKIMEESTEVIEE